MSVVQDCEDATDERDGVLDYGEAGMGNRGIASMVVLMEGVGEGEWCMPRGERFLHFLRG